MARSGPGRTWGLATDRLSRCAEYVPGTRRIWPNPVEPGLPEKSAEYKGGQREVEGLRLFDRLVAGDERRRGRSMTTARPAPQSRNERASASRPRGPEIR